jgi:CRISPR-associated protein Cas2
MMIENIIEELNDQEDSGSNSYFVSVIYDITDNKRRNKMNKLLASYGERVQRSAFECWLTKSEIAALEKKAVQIIDEEEDSLIIYRIAKSDVVKRYGRAPVTEDKTFILI